jgi:hypothetical protein
VSAFQENLGDLNPGESAWVGIVAAHHGDPFGAGEAQGWLDSYVAGKNVSALVDAEINA